MRLFAKVNEISRSMILPTFAEIYMTTVAVLLATVIQSPKRLCAGGTLVTQRSTVTPRGIVADFDSSFANVLPPRPHCISGCDEPEETTAGQIVTRRTRKLEVQQVMVEFVTVPMPPSAPVIDPTVMFDATMSDELTAKRNLCETLHTVLIDGGRPFRAIRLEARLRVAARFRRAPPLEPELIKVQGDLPSFVLPDLASPGVFVLDSIVRYEVTSVVADKAANTGPRCMPRRISGEQESTWLPRRPMIR